MLVFSKTNAQDRRSHLADFQLITPPHFLYGLNQISDWASRCSKTLLFLILMTCSICSTTTTLLAQPSCNDCKPSGGPTYKCISGNVSDLIISGDLLPYSSALTTPQYVVIEGNLTIDVPYVFTNSSVLIPLHNKGIKVSQNKDFKIQDSEIRGCDYMWNGIVLENKAFLEVKNSLIKDAKYAISIDAGVEDFVGLDVINSDFEANYVSLNLSLRKYPTTTSDADISIYRERGIISTNFYLNEPLLPDYSGIINDDYPKVGIYIKDISEIEFGGSEFYTGDENNFTGIGPCNEVLCDDDPIQYAFFIYRTNTTIRKTKIDDIIYAVRAVGARSFPIERITYIGLGLGGGDPITMENVRNAFDITRMEVIAHSSKIQRGGPTDSKLMDFDSDQFLAGVYQTQITSNIITNASSPTIIFTNYVMNNGLVLGNDISLANTGYWGEVIGVHFSTLTKNNLSIYENDIELASTGSQSFASFRGIHISNQEKGVIARNLIDGSTTKNIGNIRLDNCEKLWLFKNNTSPSTGLQSTPLAKGFKIYETRNCTYSCNRANNLYTGMEYAGDCTYSDLQRNSMSYDFKGLHLTGNFNTQIGTQPDRQNGWAGTNSYSGGYEAINEGPGYNQSIFYVPQSTASDYWPDPYSPSNWFVNSSGPSGYPQKLQCLDTIYTHEPNGPVDADLGMGDNLVDPDDALISGVYDPDSIYGASMIRDAEIQLFDKMVNFPDLITSSIEAESWYDSMELSNLGVIYTVDQTYRSIGTLSGTDETTFNNFQDSIQLIQQFIQLLHDAIYEETDTLLVDSLSTLREDASLDLLDIQNRSEAFYDGWLLAQMDLASNALDDINGISPLNTWETNFINLLRILLESTINETFPNFTTNQTDSLESIADQCRYLGGISVVRARGLTLGLAGFEVDEDEYCDPRNTVNIKADYLDTRPLTIYPNPASTDATIEIPTGIESGRIIVRDMTGKQLMDFNVRPGYSPLYQLSLHHLPTGMYNISLYTPERTVYVAPLSLQK